MLLDDLRRHPLSTSREIADRILAETGGSPSIVTGAIWYPAWTVLRDLYVLESKGLVQRVQVDGRKRIGWFALEEADSITPPA
jgi:hypothetical protein